MTTLPAQVALNDVTFNAARAAIAVLADGHERQGTELEELKSLVAQLTLTVQTQAQTITQLQQQFANTSTGNQLTGLATQIDNLAAQLVQVEETARARIDRATAIAEVVYARQLQIAAEAVHDKPVVPEAPRNALKLINPVQVEPPKQDDGTERALKRALRKVRKARQQSAHRVVQERGIEEEWLEEPPVRGLSLDQVWIDEAELLAA
ncbi:hypothetical protein [Burkholderia gladioli]|uniref:hypothetical protein n=1 Tax=Burkholderia gladioli TaxID=28095 RepID=UPI003D240364